MTFKDIDIRDEEEEERGRSEEVETQTSITSAELGHDPEMVVKHGV